MSERIKRYILVHRPGETQPVLYPSDGSDYHALCHSRDVARIEAENARLEASHAELLDALHVLTAVVGKTPKARLGCASQDTATNNSALQEAFDIARAAIAKAEGEVMPFRNT